MQAKRNTIQHDSSDLLSLIGCRVRSLRAHRGMTRRLLVAKSAISERHLAQLEMGKGNMSIALLERVARALETDLSDLVRGGQHESVERVLISEQLQNLSTAELEKVLEWLHQRYFSKQGIRQRVALIGLRGAGKTTLGKRLAEHYKIPFVQLVAEIEKLAGMDTSVIFELSGQSGYRRLEEKVLSATLTNYPACVIEAGGSIVSNLSLFNLLLTGCTVVWIRAQPGQHMQRVIDQDDLRPMAGNDDAMSDLRRILEEREPLYAKAHHILDTSSGTVGDCAAELAKITRFDESVCSDHGSEQTLNAD